MVPEQAALLLLTARRSSEREAISQPVSACRGLEIPGHPLVPRERHSAVSTRPTHHSSEGKNGHFWTWPLSSLLLMTFSITPSLQELLLHGFCCS